ncbi:hypothetical protein [Endozoicomonas euniceicola]|uniref:Gamma-glutamylcyclotransferase AIG2-like domain-containing protein n=1 Tax=Endozoicomonas euniceicola TaxID=1234143 RepID=A0ABY6H064_9GAMM|nr:hypothetical protein [Endozoicomonas euniceicola]UYM18440.1 hypothetical protein NX720_11240 [Endozoicomonas euniceicola]
MWTLRKVPGAAVVSLLVSLLAIGSLLFTPETSAMDTDCFPVLDEKQPQYVVAYGQYMHEGLREQKIKKKYNSQLPVWISGYQRGWMTRIKDEGKYTTLGVAPEAGKLLNGILVEVRPGIINTHDRTERRMCRTRLDRKSISSMTGQVIPSKGEFWIYTTKKASRLQPAGKFPILMSEVDEFLTGCIEQAEQFNLTNFPEQCIDTTDFWSKHWTNDRERPLTGRLVQVKRRKVDSLLSKLKGGLYENVRAE